MISLTTHPAQKTSTAKPSQRQQTETPTLTKAQGLQQDMVQIRKQSKEEVFAEAQKLLTQAEASPVPEIKLLGVNKALKKLKTQTANESNKDVQAKQEQSLEALLKENAEIRKELDTPSHAANSPNYPRPVSQVEVTLVDHLLQDLAHPDAEMAKQAHERLKKLGVSEELLKKITQSIKQPKAKHPLTFSGGTIEKPEASGMTDASMQHSLLDEARNQVFANSTPTQVINTGVEHHLATVQHATNPVHFGGGGYYTIGHDHNGYPITDWSYNLT